MGWDVEVVRELTDPRGEVLALSWSPRGDWLAASYSYGAVKLFDTETFRLNKLFSMRSVTTMPFTSLCWEPLKSSRLLAVSADAHIGIWDAESGALVKAGTLPVEQGLCCDIAPDGEVFAVGTNAAAVVITNTRTMQTVTMMTPGHDTRKGHTSRVMAVKWVRKDVLLSAGWDCVVFLWDVTSNTVIKSFYRAFVCGAALDTCGSEALVGSYDRKEQIQVYDYFTSEARTVLSLTEDTNGKVLACQFSRADEGKLTATVGDRVRVYDSASFELVYRDEPEEFNWFACDWARQELLLAAGSAGGTIQVLEFTKLT